MEDAKKTNDIVERKALKVEEDEKKK